MGRAAPAGNDRHSDQRSVEGIRDPERTPAADKGRVEEKVMDYHSKYLIPKEAPEDAQLYARTRIATELVGSVLGKLIDGSNYKIRLTKEEHEDVSQNSYVFHARIDLDEIVTCKECEYNNDGYNCVTAKALGKDGYCSNGKRWNGQYEYRV